MSEILGLVRLEHDIHQNCRTVKTIKSFRPGETIMREKALVDCEVDSDVNRLTSFCNLGAALQAEFMRVFTDLEIKQRGMSLDDVNLNNFEELLKKASVQGPGLVALSKQEVAAVMIRWQFACSISKIRIFRTTSKVLHHCGANVDFEFDLDFNMGVTTARYDIPPQTKIGTWMLKDADCWWKGADQRQAQLIAEGVMRNTCRCDRCLGPDVCRAMICPDCAEGEFWWHEKAERWRCTRCGFESSGDAASGLMGVERQLVEEVGDAILVAVPDELHGWVETIEVRLGGRHWLMASLWKAIYARFSGRRGEETFTSVAAGISFLEWLLWRGLPRPPQELHGSLTTMAFRVLDFLHARMLGVRDLRVVFLRVLDVARRLLERMDRRLLDRMAPHLGAAVNMRRHCAFCSCSLPEEASDDEQEWLPPSCHAEEVFVECAAPVTCAVCQELRYCDVGCQLSDSSRHRPYCVPKKERLCSRLVSGILMPVR